MHGPVNNGASHTERRKFEHLRLRQGAALQRRLRTNRVRRHVRVRSRKVGGNIRFNFRVVVRTGDNDTRGRSFPGPVMLLVASFLGVVHEVLGTFTS